MRIKNQSLIPNNVLSIKSDCLISYIMIIIMYFINLNRFHQSSLKFSYFPKINTEYDMDSSGIVCFKLLFQFFW
jgi:hypothetical protein